MWRASDLVERFIFVALALMLSYTVFVVVRFYRRYIFVRGEFPSDSTPAAERSKTNLVAELSRGVGTLKSIAYAAPFLGLAGMDYGILAALFRGYIGSRGSLLALFSMEMAGALGATTAGLIVATPAAVSYNVLRTCLEKLELTYSNPLFEATSRPYGLAQTLPLRRRFSRLPAFALIAAPVLGILVLMFTLVDTERSVGLPVYLSKMSPDAHAQPPIIVSVTASSVRGQTLLYVNSKQTPWNELGNTIRTLLNVHPDAMAYIEAGGDVPWQDVANVIDVAKGLQAKVVLLTAKPSPESNQSRGKKTR